MVPGISIIHSIGCNDHLKYLHSPVIHGPSYGSIYEALWRKEIENSAITHGNIATAFWLHQKVAAALLEVGLIRGIICVS